MSDIIYSGHWFTKEVKSATESERARNTEAPKVPIQRPTFEDMDHLMEQAKLRLHWMEVGLSRRISLGTQKQPFTFDLHKMRKFSSYFHWFSIPTISNSFMIGSVTDRLAELTLDEVLPLFWIINWCHDEVRQRGQLHKVHPRRSFDQWSMVWTLADALRMPIMAESVYQSLNEMLMERHMPSADIINYLFKHRPYSRPSQGSGIYRGFVACYASQPGPFLASTSGTFESGFVKDVLQTRKVYRQITSGVQGPPILGGRLESQLEIDHDQTAKHRRRQEAIDDHYRRRRQAQQDDKENRNNAVNSASVFLLAPSLGKSDSGNVNRSLPKAD